jgi:hypothetical protein
MKNKIILLLSSGMLSACGQMREDLVHHIGSFLEHGADTNALDVTCRTAHKALEPKQVEFKEALKAIKEDFTTNQDLLKMTDSLRALPLSDEIKTWFVQKVINPSLPELINRLCQSDNDYLNKPSIDSQDEDIHWLCARLNNQYIVNENFASYTSRYHGMTDFLGHCVLTLPTSKQKYNFMSTIANWAMSCYISKIFHAHTALLQELRSYTPDNPNEHVDQAIRNLSQNS